MQHDSGPNVGYTLIPKRAEFLQTSPSPKQLVATELNARKAADEQLDEIAKKSAELPLTVAKSFVAASSARSALSP